MKLSYDELQYLLWALETHRNYLLSNDLRGHEPECELLKVKLLESLKEATNEQN